jgi:hypothetical protein
MMSRLLLLRYVFVKRVEILISGRGLPLNIFPGDKDVFLAICSVVSVFLI